MAGQRLLGLNAIRSNPNVIGHSLTGTLDQGMTAEGVWTTFRELKPGATDALFDGWAPLRWCLFAEPVNVYRGTPVKLEAVLANEDVLAPGEYPVRLQVVGPNLTRVFEKRITVKIADPEAQARAADGAARLRRGRGHRRPAGHVSLPGHVREGRGGLRRRDASSSSMFASDEMPKVATEVVLLESRRRPGRAGSPRTASGTDPTRPVEPGRREVILASGKPAGDPAEVFRDLARRIAHGSTVIFLTTDTYARGDQPTGWLPLKTKGTVRRHRPLAVSLRRVGQAAPDLRGAARRAACWITATTAS